MERTEEQTQQGEKREGRNDRGNRGERGDRGDRGERASGPEGQEFQERVVAINRVAKVVKGGRRFSFSALVVAGSGSGDVGFGTGKAGEVPEAITKAGRSAKKSIRKVQLKESRTIPHEVIGRYGACKVIMVPAAPGTGVIAGGAVRAVLESAGVKDILTKCVGTRNPHNAVRATLDGLLQLVATKPNRE